MLNNGDLHHCLSICFTANTAPPHVVARLYTHAKTSLTEINQKLVVLAAIPQLQVPPSEACSRRHANG